MKTFSKILFSVFILTNLAFSQVQITNTNVYKMADQMLLANEINESGEPYAEALGYNLDDLDPFVLNTPDSIAYTLGIENYEYSRYQLGTVISRSGIGLHMIWAPMIIQMAAMEADPNFDGSMTGTPNGFKEDDELMKNIMHFSMLANQAPPGNPWPQFAEFISGNPHLPQTIDPNNFRWADFSTLRWDRSLMDKTLNLSAMGQSLMKQYLWAQDMLGAFHDSSDNGIDADGIISPDSAGSIHFDPANNVFYGGNNLDGFVGQVLTAEGANKTMFLINSLAYDGNALGGVDPMTYDPANGIKYFPHKISVTESEISPTMPPKGTAFSVIDASSQLWDQISYLWGSVNFQNMSDPNNSSDSKHLAYKEVFDGDPFPAPMAQTGMPGVFDLFMGTSKVLTLNILAMHYNLTEGTFVDEANLNGGVVQQGSYISTFNAGYTIAILKQVVEEFTGSPLAQSTQDALIAQADFIVNNLQHQSGRFYNGYTIGTGADVSATLLETQSAAIRGLVAAYELTNDANYFNAAQSGYNYLISNFYVSSLSAFRSEDGNNLATYTPLNFAALSGALREANLVLGSTESPIIYTRFFKKVANKMQLSEDLSTGESGIDSDGDGVPYIPEQSDNLPPVFAAEATLDLSTTSVEDEIVQVTDYRLEQNYPNPFNPSTIISFDVPEDSYVRLKIFNIIGQEVVQLVNENKTAGRYQVNWNGVDNLGNKVTSGVYLYSLKANDRTFTKKMILAK